MKKKKDNRILPIVCGILIVGLILIFLFSILPRLNEPQFEITKEECTGEKGFEVYCGNENFGMKIWSDIELNESEESLVNLFLMVDEDLKDCKLVNGTSCEQVEVDELVVCCLDTETINSFENLSNHADLGSTITKNDYFENYCFPKENLEYYEVPCGIMKKADLTTEWLELNAECVRRLKCYINKECDCEKYKFGEYYIELK